MASPNQPFVVSGYCYDTDETTLLTSGEVHAYNTTTDEHISDSVNSSGEYLIDLANLTSGWSDGNVIRIEIITNDNKLGFFYFTARTSDNGVYEKNMYVQYITDFQRMLQDHGESITLQAATVTISSEGHSTTTYVNHLLFGMPVYVGAESDEFKEGVLALGDLLFYVSYNDTNKQFASENNNIVFDGGTYKIKNVIKEKSPYKGNKFSHYELFCKKVD